MTQVTRNPWYSNLCLAWGQPQVNLIITLRPRQDGRHFADDIFKCVFLNENISISINISLKFVPKGPINNIPALVQIMAWRHPGDKPLSEPMMMGLLTNICVTRPQWVMGVNHCHCNRSLAPGPRIIQCHCYSDRYNTVWLLLRC